MKPSIGAQDYGYNGYFKLPMHKMETHTKDNIRWLWDKFKVVIGQFSGEVVENKNQDVCKFASHNTNNRNDAGSIYNSLYYQLMRHMLVKLYCYPNTLLPEPSTFRNRLECCKCGRCGIVGDHTGANKKKCLQHPDYKGPDGLSSDDDD